MSELNDTDTMLPTYEELLQAVAHIADCMADHPQRDYVREALVKLTLAGKVTRLDLHHLVTFIDYVLGGMERHYTDAESVLVKAYEATDRAAAFGTTYAPLVVVSDATARHANLSGWELLSVLPGDDEDRKATKRAWQKPSLTDWRG